MLFHVLANLFWISRDGRSRRLKQWLLNKYFNEYGDEEKFIWIMSNEDIDQMNCLGTFIKNVIIL